MAERGAAPLVPVARRRALALVRSFTSPLLPDDYLELVNPLWSTRELRGRVLSVTPETAEAVTITIKPGWEWPSHRPGQYVRLGVAVDGRHHWRAYSLTSAPARADGCIAITPKLVPDGQVSPYLCRRLTPGTIVRLGGVEGEFVLPDSPARKILLVSAGSGITPVMSMVRHLLGDARVAGAGGATGAAPIVHLHSAPAPELTIFGAELRALASRHRGYRLLERHTRTHGRLHPDELDTLCPDWRERETFVCGPAQLLATLRERWREQGDPALLHHEHFQPATDLGAGEHGAGGTVRFLRSDVETSGDGSRPILALGEQAGACLPHGCRMGICHSCTGRLRSGRVRDLRTGRIHGQPGESVQTCINAPEGPIEIDL